MSSTSWSDRPPEDLTARARIRDAALAQFAKRGFKGATIKDIAQAAGVSVGLVQHHFGAKEDLRQACDDYVTGALGDLDSYGLSTGEITNPDFMAELYRTSPLILGYVARAMVEGSPVAASFFDTAARVAEEFLTTSWPQRFPPASTRARDAAAVMTAMHLATIVLHEHLSRRMGGDVLAPHNSPRIGLAMFDLYVSMGEFASSDLGASIRDAVPGLGPETPSTNGTDDE